MSFVRKLKQRARSWSLPAILSDRSGLAMIEFAMVTPVVLVMGLAGTEMANLAVTNLRISQATMHIADNASRIGDRDALAAQRIFEGDINDIFIGVNIQAGSQIDLFENGRVIVSSLEANSDGGQWIHWQRCMGKKNVASIYGAEGTGDTGTDFDGMGKSGEELQAQSGEAIMYVEIVYDYQPLIDNGITREFLPDAPIRSEAAFHVRGTRDLSGIFQRATPSAPSTCDKFETI